MLKEFCSVNHKMRIKHSKILHNKTAKYWLAQVILYTGDSRMTRDSWQRWQRKNNLHLLRRDVFFSGKCFL